MIRSISRRAEVGVKTSEGRSIGITPEEAGLTDAETHEALRMQCQVVATQPEQIPERTSKGLSWVGDYLEATNPAYRAKHGMLPSVLADAFTGRNLPPVTRRTAEVFLEGAPKFRRVDPRWLMRTNSGRALIDLLFGTRKPEKLKPDQKQVFNLLANVMSEVSMVHNGQQAERYETYAGRLLNELAGVNEWVILLEKDIRAVMRVVAEEVRAEEQRHLDTLVKHAKDAVADVRLKMAAIEEAFSEKLALLEEENAALRRRLEEA